MPWDIKKIICIVVPLAILLLPTQFIPIEGLTVVEKGSKKVGSVLTFQQYVGPRLLFLFVGMLELTPFTFSFTFSFA